MVAQAFSGGCQCGAVRYRIESAIRYPHVCHCRMCQKASGNYFLPLGASDRTQFSLTRGEPNWFQSSDHVRRGFCGACGTPLFYDIPDADFINVTLGSLDEPQRVKPEAQSNLSGKMAWFSALDDLPAEVEPENDTCKINRNRQHPDHDTRHWPPQDTSSMSDELRSFYPEIEPFETGMLDVGDGHMIYWERVGTKGAKPAVFLHGGPGGGVNPTQRRVFDPELYDVILFDQRGCGRSTPHASLEANTTWHLVADMEKLRETFGFEKWQVFGGSWGSTLALAYAETHPERVSELVLRGIYMLTKRELDWYYQFGVSEMYPDRWETFIAPIPEEERGEMMRSYNRYLTGSDEVKKLECAKAWSQWEGATISLVTDQGRVDTFGDDKFAIAFARIETHYFVNAGWFEEGQLLRDAYKLKDIPGVIVHGRYDMPCPLRTAWDLAKAWPKADFHIVEAAGHALSEPGILDQLIRATDRFAGK